MMVGSVIWLSGAMLVGLVVAISVVDLRALTIPDGLNAALAFSGLGFQAFMLQGVPIWPLVGGLVLALAMYVMRQVYLNRSGVVGLGLGDVKMAGASAIWLHPANLPVFVFLSSIIALVSVLAFGRRDRRFRETGRFPFGPFLGLGLIACWSLETFFGFGLLAG